MDSNSTQSIKRPRTSEDFYMFCQIVLEHENYNERVRQDERARQEERVRQEELRTSANSPMDSAGSINSESTVSSMPDDKMSSSSDENENDSDSVDSDSYNLVTCYCGKPFAARPMIECSICLTWIHLTCAKVKRNNIPDVFSCYKCKDKQLSSAERQNHRSRKRATL